MMFEKKSEEFLRKARYQIVHSEALNAAKSYQDAEGYLYRVIEVVDDRIIYEDCDLTSLYQYCTKLLHLSEATSYALISVIRKGREVPQLRDAVLNGKVSLSKAKKICSVINKENYQEWIELAACATSRIIEKCVAQANPKECVIETATYKTADRIELKLGVSEEFMKLYQEAKDLLSQKESKAVSGEEALLFALKGLVEKLSPVRKAKRALKRSQKQDVKNAVRLMIKDSVRRDTLKECDNDPQFLGTVEKISANKRKSIARVTIHKVSLRDNNQCAYQSMHGRCEQKRWLDIHHIVPVSKGGTNELANLTTLCSAHHRMEHDLQRQLFRSRFDRWATAQITILNLITKNLATSSLIE